ncbi:hypothetical protein BDZ89DRAFT_1140433 [Hymenopellis radicata]|nr:hypothetical protein BDZ89DRAFT_1141409 [Hymenopellis radicata]KAF9017879.1 hypothetical protein BDZ89DRAFT_1140433 [Hymenopellis radicata]
MSSHALTGMQVLPDDVLGLVGLYLPAAVDLGHLRATSRAVSLRCTRYLFHNVGIPIGLPHSQIREFLDKYGDMPLSVRITDYTLVDLALLLPHMPQVKSVFADSCILWVPSETSLSDVTPRSQAITSWTFSRCTVSWPSLTSLWRRMFPHTAAIHTLRLRQFTSSLESASDSRIQSSQSTSSGALTALRSLEINVEGADSIRIANLLLLIAVHVETLVIVVIPEHSTVISSGWPLLDMLACRRLSCIHVTLNMGDRHTFGQALLFGTPRLPLAALTVLVRFQRLTDAVDWFTMWRSPHIFASAIISSTAGDVNLGIILPENDAADSSSIHELRCRLDADQWRRAMCRCLQQAIPRRTWCYVPADVHFLICGHLST